MARLPRHIYEHLADLAVEAWITPEPVPFAKRTAGRHKVFKHGDAWGKLWDCAWFHFTGAVPKGCRGKMIVLLIDLNGEGLVVDENGEPVQGLTSSSSDYDYSLGKPGKCVVPVAERARGNETIDLWVEAGCNDLFGRVKNDAKIEDARIAIRRNELQMLCFDFEVLRELLNQLSSKSARYACVLHTLYEASLVLGPIPSDQEVALARAILQRELSRRNADPCLTISAVGHAHIDLGWLWPIRETIRKGARTFSTALRMMERYPGYVFGESQPQLYLWMKDHYPSLYADLKKRVKQGRWEVQGAFWVEPDCNIPSGESLVRQILLGKRFFKREFDVEVKNIWEPDVFGYSGSLPQIFKKSGLDYFLTQKLSWSLFNAHPYHTFHWEGIDGSRVLVHMPSEATYNSSAAPRALAKAEQAYLEKGLSENCLLLFGIGDGGGGPGEEHLERLEREKNLQGLPPVVQEPAATFFEKLSLNADRYPVWRGELYLEYHQGTLTSQSRNKRYNRKLELALRDLEFSACQALRLSGKTYPAAELEKIWQEVLLYQFHDILPGSSITRVYDESLARYAALAEQVATLTAKADSTWVPGQAVVNSLSWDRTEWIKADGRWRLAQVPGMGCAPIPSKTPMLPVVTASITSLENEHLLAEFDEGGNLVSVLHKASGRKAFRPGEFGNEMLVYEDPGDAWDFAPDYDALAPARCTFVSAKARQDGPVGILTQVRRFGHSTITQEIRLAAGSRRLDFKTRVDWKESGKMLRVQFPANVNSDSARCEIQFGNIARPTTQNTSWEAAKHEVCGQKWVDISERSFGVALLNDCKYGHQVHGGILNLNLLRSPTYPDPVADRAVHEFTYSLLPHTGDYAEGGVVREAYELNVPLRVAKGEGVDSEPLMRIDKPNVILEAAKKAEDSQAFILRLYEAHGASARAQVSFGFAPKSVALVNLMEETPTALKVHGNTVQVDFKPFEIVTLMVTG